MRIHVTDFYQNQAHAQQYLGRRIRNLIGQFRHSRQVMLINEVIRQHQPKTALEIACGPGRITREIGGIRQGIAIDTSQSMIDIARQQVDEDVWDFCVSDAFSLPFVQTFDLIVTIRFLWHFSLSERSRLYQVVQERLSSGGIFVFDALTTNRFMSARTQTKMYEKRYHNISSLVDELDTHGFQVCSALGYLNHPNLQHTIAAMGDIAGTKRPVLSILNLIEKIKPTRSEEYIVTCRKK